MGHPIHGTRRAPYLLVGEAPNAAGDGPWILKPDNSGELHSANRLLVYTGWIEALGSRERARLAHWETFDRANLLQACPPISGRGRAFDVGEARSAARGLILEAQRGKYRGLVVLGFRAARAFGWHASPHDLNPISLDQVRAWPLKWLLAGYRGRGVGETKTVFAAMRAAVVPHPSGVNRWWNDPANRDRAREFFAELHTRAPRVDDDPITAPGAAMGEGPP